MRSHRPPTPRSKCGTSKGVHNARIEVTGESVTGESVTATPLASWSWQHLELALAGTGGQGIEGQHTSHGLALLRMLTPEF